MGVQNSSGVQLASELSHGFVYFPPLFLHILLSLTRLKPCIQRRQPLHPSSPPYNYVLHCLPVFGKPPQKHSLLKPCLGYPKAWSSFICLKIEWQWQKCIWASLCHRWCSGQRAKLPRFSDARGRRKTFGFGTGELWRPSDTLILRKNLTWSTLTGSGMPGGRGGVRRRSRWEKVFSKWEVFVQGASSCGRLGT